MFLVHGEKEASKGLKQKIEEVYNYECLIPALNQVIEI
ncbi:MBL fold metallo-hydrolase RNA specificity domain-containing protein [Flavobacterium haoranii]|nr:MBL fold metallo-hydrolase RNA specificity domain-containing protein [Flavobacterium haoranii]